MNKKYHYNAHLKEAAIFNNRMMQISIAVLILTVLLIVRLFYLQVIEQKTYSTLSQKNILTIIPLPPRRGLIFDRNGTIIADNVPSYNLNITPSKAKNINTTLTELNHIIPLTKNELKDFHSNLYQYHRYEPIPLKLHLNELQIARVYVNRYRLPGVNISVSFTRNYPQKQYLSSVLGYVGRINSRDLKNVNKQNYRATNFIGKVGIEKYYETLLHGTIGSAIAEINASGHIIRYVKKIPAISGQNLHLSIDSMLQQYIYKTMRHVTGAAVAIDPENGQVLAMVSTPSYNPNDFVTGISNKDYHALITAPNNPLFNRSIRGLFSPGSTIKPFYALSALTNHLITKNTTIFDPGWFRLPNTKHIYHDWKHNGHGWVNVTKAITVSCDTFFYNLAVQMGISRMDKSLYQFGFGEPTGIDMGEELAGTVPSPTWKRSHQHEQWYTGDTIITGIGQGSLLVTPLQLAEATATIAERGKRFKPHLLLYSELNHQKTLNKKEEEPNVYPSNQKVWNTVIKAMETVIYNYKGTAINFGKNTSYIAAGKTGTAQVYGKNRDEEYTRTNIPKRLRNNHLFIVFAPVKHPKIALAIVIEHASVADGVARKILDYYLHKRIKADHHIQQKAKA